MAEKTVMTGKITGKIDKIYGYFSRLEREAKEPGFLKAARKSFASVWLLVTRIPLPGALALSPALPSARDIAALPFAGAVFGLIAVLPAWLLAFAVPPSVSGWIASGIYILSGWSLHLDGWGDLWDGLGSGRRGDEMMVVMKDSRVGSFGVAGITLAIAVRSTLFAEIKPSGWLAAAALAGGVGRFALTVTAFLGKYPWERGMGREIVKNFGGYELFLSLIVSGPLFFLAPSAWIAGIALASLASFGLAAWTDKNIGGVNGDVLGASAVQGELIALAVYAVLS
jgi:adenosylcobinamide-GDP ribazoletransferase